MSASAVRANGRGRQHIRDVGNSGQSTTLLVCVTPTQDFVMALWKENSNTVTAPAPTKDASIMTPVAEPALKREHDIAPTDISQAPRRVAPRDVKESVVAAEITITGKIVGAGHVRIAGKFEGDVHIDGDLTIEQGAKLTGSIKAESVAIAGGTSRRTGPPCSSGSGAPS